MKKTVIIDNYDSFTYNLVHYVEEICNELPTVYRNDAIAVNALNNFDQIIFSPGPGLPRESKIMHEVLKTFSSSKKILGICLGHQCIIEFYGGKIYNLSKVYHGISTPVTVNTKTKIFAGLNGSIEAGRYHSWAAFDNEIPQELESIANDENGINMAVKHRHYDITGIQFHPESILTPQGKSILKNWLS